MNVFLFDFVWFRGRTYFPFVDSIWFAFYLPSLPISLERRHDDDHELFELCVLSF